MEPISAKTLKSEYKVLQANNTHVLEGELNTLARQGWKPIMMSTIAGTQSAIVTVIVEHVF